MSARAQWSAVVVTQGNRERQCAAAVESLLAQSGVDLEVIVVGNGWEPRGLPPQVRTVHVPRNSGAPRGRNHGLEHATGDLVYFLDDDATLPHADTLATIEQILAADPEIGVVQTRIASPDGVTARRWVPRLRDKNPERSSVVFSVLEGSVAVRSAVLDHTRGWAGRFGYAHEGIELAWRAWDAGYTVHYRADLLAHHPLVARSRHADFMRLDARNRVWVAKRNLPLAIATCYVAMWALATLARNLRAPRSYAAWLRGAWEGVRTSGGKRRPIAWRTVWLMTRHGRPPIL